MFTPIKYATTVNYFIKKKHTVLPGIDFLTLLHTWKPALIEAQKRRMKVFTANTNISYDEVDKFPGLFFWSVVTYQKFWLANTILLSNDEFTFPALQIYYWSKQIKITCYGLLFRFCEIYGIDRKEILYFFQEYYNLVSYDQSFSRVDYKRDFFNITPTVFVNHLKNNNRWSFDWRNIREFKKGNELETIEIGDRANKFSFIRIYNKTIDTKKKKKVQYYFDYTNPTTRFEVELGTKFIEKGMHIEEIIAKMYQYLWFTKKIAPYYKSIRYDPNFIADTQAYLNDRVKRTTKLLVNNIDLRKAIKQINDDQQHYRLRINKTNNHNETQN